MLLHRFCFGPLETNAFLLGCPKTKRAALIDAPMGCTAAIAHKAAHVGLTIEALLLTHSHWDHTADAYAFKKKTGAPIYVHALDRGNLEKPGSDGLPLFTPILAAEPDHFLTDDQMVEIGTLKIRAIHTPGHTPGGICYYVASDKKVFTGDTLFQGSIGTLGFPTANPPLMWESLKKLGKLPPDTLVLPGHGPDTTIGTENWLDSAEDMFG
jgi:hydroxyacylglutathione hydrolase